MIRREALIELIIAIIGVAIAAITTYVIPWIKEIIKTHQLNRFTDFAVKAVSLSGQLSDKVIIFLAAVLLAAVIRECRLYVKESEDLSWNFC